jgi:hypothetical protein
MSNEGTCTYPTVVNNVEYDQVEKPDGNSSASDKTFDGFLNPNIELNNDLIVKNLYKSDKIFARLVVNLVAHAANNGVFACTTYGYPFQELPVFNIDFSSDFV